MREPLRPVRRQELALGLRLALAQDLLLVQQQELVWLLALEPALPLGQPRVQVPLRLGRRLALQSLELLLAQVSAQVVSLLELG